MGRDAFRTAAFAAGAAWLAGCTALLGLDDKTFDGAGGAASTSSGAGGAGGTGGGGGAPSGGRTVWAIVSSVVGGSAAIGGLAVDAGGTIWVAGDFSGTLTLGTCPPITASGLRSAFWAKLGPQGSCDATGTFSAGSDEEVVARDIAVDPTGGVVLAGRFQGTVEVPQPAQSLTSAGSSDMFALKLDPQGNPVWSWQYGGAAFESAESVAVDAAGHTSVAGAIPGAGGQDVLVANLDPAGVLAWGKPFGSVEDDAALAVAVFPADGRVAAAGVIGATANVDSTQLFTTAENAFAVTFSAAGTAGFGAANPETGPSAMRALAFDPSGDALFVAGGFQDTLKLEADPGATPIKTLTATDVNGFVARLDLSGTADYAQVGQFEALLSPSPDRISALAVDPQSGDVVAAGAVRGEISFVDAQGAAAGGDDIVVARLDPTLTHVRWMRVIGEQGGPDSDQSAAAAAFDPTTGITVVAGTFTGSVDFGEGSPREASTPELFILALEP